MVKFRSVSVCVSLWKQLTIMASRCQEINVPNTAQRQLSFRRRVSSWIRGLDPRSCCMRARVSLGKTPNPPCPPSKAPGCAISVEGTAQYWCECNTPAISVRMWLRVRHFECPEEGSALSTVLFLNWKFLHHFVRSFHLPTYIQFTDKFSDLCRCYVGSIKTKQNKLARSLCCFLVDETKMCYFIRGCFCLCCV